MVTEEELVDAVSQGIATKTLQNVSPFYSVTSGLLKRFGFDYDRAISDVHVKPMVKAVAAEVHRQQATTAKLSEGDLAGAARTNVAYVTSYAGNSMVTQAAELGSISTAQERGHRIWNGLAEGLIGTSNDLLGTEIDVSHWQFATNQVLPSDALVHVAHSVDEDGARWGQEFTPLGDFMLVTLATEGLMRLGPTSVRPQGPIGDTTPPTSLGPVTGEGGHGTLGSWMQKRSQAFQAQQQIDRSVLFHENNGHVGNGAWTAKPNRLAPPKVVDKSWKLKIEGVAQKTGTDGHQFRTYREAIAEAKKPNVRSVHLDPLPERPHSPARATRHHWE